MESFLHIPYFFFPLLHEIFAMIRIVKKYKSFRIFFKCVFQSIIRLLIHLALLKFSTTLVES